MFESQTIPNKGGFLLIYIAIGVAGMLGALLRYYVGIWIPTTWIWGFPLGTLLINLAGSFCLSWFTVWSTRYASIPSWLKTGIATGFIGSFTTFSTFSVEVLTLVQHHAWLTAIVYVLLSAWGGFFLCWSGYRIAMYGKEKEQQVVRTS